MDPCWARRGPTHALCNAHVLRESTAAALGSGLDVQQQAEDLPNLRQRRPTDVPPHAADPGHRHGSHVLALGRTDRSRPFARSGSIRNSAPRSRSVVVSGTTYTTCGPPSKTRCAVITT